MYRNGRVTHFSGLNGVWGGGGPCRQLGTVNLQQLNFYKSCCPYPPPRRSIFCRPFFATSRDLRLPGKDIASPEVFAFGTPFRSLYDTLKRKDEAFFLKNNLLRLAARNATVKVAPQRFQDIEGPDMAGFDVVLCFEARVFYSVVEGNSNRVLRRYWLCGCMDVGKRKHSGWSAREV